MIKFEVIKHPRENPSIIQKILMTLLILVIVAVITFFILYIITTFLVGVLGLFFMAKGLIDYTFGTFLFFIFSGMIGGNLTIDMIVDTFKNKKETFYPRALKVIKYLWINRLNELT